MNSWKGTLAVCRETWAESLAKPQFFAALLFIFIYTAMQNLNTVAMYAQDAGRLMVPEVIIFSLGGSLDYLFLVAGFYIFLMQAPFLARTDAVFLPRVQRGAWIWGKLLFVTQYLLLATLANNAFTVLVCAPYIDFSRWTAWTPYLVENLYLGDAIEAVTPLYGLFCTWLLNLSLLLSIALLTLFLNLYYRRTFSLLAVGALCVSSLIVDMSGPRYARLDPIAHATFLSHQFQGVDNVLGGPAHFTPAIWESFLLYGAACAILLFLILRRVRCYDFQMNGKGMN